MTPETRTEGVAVTSPATIEPDSSVTRPSTTDGHVAGPNIAAQVLPVLPLKNTVLFPTLFLPLNVGRPNSVAAIEAALGLRYRQCRQA